MIYLPTGITGYGSASCESPVTEVEFKQLCYQFGHHFGLMTVELIPTYSGNYYICKVTGIKEELYILMNHQYPYIAFANKYESGNASYIENQNYTDYINNLEHRLTELILDKPFSKYYALSMKELDELLSVAMIADLDKSERKEIKYWSPAAVKDVIFNNWD